MTKDDMISPGNRRTLQIRTRRNGFDQTKQTVFIEHFAGNGNATQSAKAAGVAVSTVYVHRARNAPFRARWAEALDQGYARMEAELVRRASLAASGAVAPVEADAAAAASLEGVDAKFLLSMLEFRRRGLGIGPGDRFPQASDVEQVRARLEKKMRALRLIDAEGNPLAAVDDDRPPGPAAQAPLDGAEGSAE
ncbi:MAG: hypothetical protein ABIW16_01040 [Sphingomicrobium sp.]